MEWTAAISGDHVGLFLDFSQRKRILGTILFSKAEMDVLLNQWFFPKLDLNREMAEKEMELDC